MLHDKGHCLQLLITILKGDHIIGPMMMMISIYQISALLAAIWLFAARKMISYIVGRLKAQITQLGLYKPADSVQTNGDLQLGKKEHSHCLA